MLFSPLYIIPIVVIVAFPLALALIRATVKILRQYERGVVFTFHAEAEFQASQTLVNAAKILSTVPAAMQLRYLQTLTEIGAEQNSTVVFPMPIDIIKPFLELLEKPGKAAGANGATRVPAIKDVSLGVSSA
jgi:regulator of protease activity HflC (stomatin/prohibitin superfamily)